jgi:hypothetical protein
MQGAVLIQSGGSNPPPVKKQDFPFDKLGMAGISLAIARLMSRVRTPFLLIIYKKMIPIVNWVVNFISAEYGIGEIKPSLLYFLPKEGICVLILILI